MSAAISGPQDLSVKAKLSILATLLAALRRQPGDPSELVRGRGGVGEFRVKYSSAAVA